VVVLLVAVTLGFAGLGFSAGWGMNKLGGTDSCPGNHCLAQVSPTAIRDSLTAHGFSCSQEGSDFWQCELRLQYRWYSVSISGPDGKAATSLKVFVSRTGPGPTEVEFALVSWTAGLPVTDDPDAAKQIGAWLRQRTSALAPGASSTARIGGVKYTLATLSRDLGGTGGYTLDIAKDLG